MARKKRRSWWKWGLASLILLAVLLAAAYAALWAAFQVGEDLLVHLDYDSSKVSLYHGEIAEKTFEITTEDEFLCTSSCEFRYTDLSSGQIIANGSFELPPKGFYRYSATMEAPLFGKGQKLYDFSVSCVHERSALCLTLGEAASRRAFLTLNYGPSPEEEDIIGYVESNLSLMLYAAARADEEMMGIEHALAGVPPSFQDAEVRTRTIILIQELDRWVTRLESYRQLWEEERYLELYMELPPLSEAWDLFNNASDVRQQMHDLEAEHNALLSRLAAFNRTALAQAISVADRLGTVLSPTVSASTLSSLVADFQTGGQSYSHISAGLDSLSRDTNQSLKTLLVVLSNLTSEGSMIYDEESRVLCLAYNYSCGSEVANNLDAVCSGLLGLHYTSPFDANITDLVGEPDYEAAVSRFEAEARNGNLAPFEADVDNRTVTFYEIASGSSIIPSAGYEKFVGSHCQSAFEDVVVPSVVGVGNLTLNFSHPASPIGTVLSENLPVCCVFGDCKPCCSDESCANDPATFPILLVHGHAVNERVSPLYSLTVFDSLEEHLVADGFLPAGFISPADKGEKGEWGLSGKPVVVKVSYYFDVYNDQGEYVLTPQKSERIDVYAVRLKDIIDTAKLMTGKPQVKVIAHSMGGLVARRYLQIFGDASVHTLIMVGTPNYGIVGQVDTLCPVLGSSFECQDMTKGSIFLKKLNDPNNQPRDVFQFTFTGMGCDMGGSDGDGIVLSANVPIEGAENMDVFGRCPSRTKLLHSLMLDPAVHPEVYNRIKEILST